MFSRLFQKRRRILLAWELGGGLGHINRLLALAEAINASDVALVFALRARAGEDRVRQRFPKAAIVESPHHVRLEDDGRQPRLAASYADILHRCGFDDPENLASLSRGWSELIELYRPSLIIADHSPSLVFTNEARLPLINVGTGFTTPPAGKPLPVLLPPGVGRTQEVEPRVLQTMQQVRRRRGGTAINSVSELWNGTHTVPCTWPELDPYRSLRDVEAAGPVEPSPGVRFSPTTGSIFGYFAGEDERVVRWLGVLANAGCGGSVFVRNAGQECAAAVAGSRLRIFQVPQPMPAALYDASALVHHGGSLANVALALGCPQVVLPRSLDQFLVGRAIEALGCGRICLAPDSLGEAVHSVVDERRYSDAARALAEQIAARRRCSPTERIAPIARAALQRS